MLPGFLIVAQTNPINLNDQKVFLNPTRINLTTQKVFLIYFSLV